MKLTSWSVPPAGKEFVISSKSSALRKSIEILGRQVSLLYVLVVRELPRVVAGNLLRASPCCSWGRRQGKVRAAAGSGDGGGVTPGPALLSQKLNGHLFGTVVSAEVMPQLG